jgi:cephalosporin hydroxylase
MSWQKIPGWFGWPETYDEMVATAPDGSTIVEIGVAFGRSLAYLGEKVLASGKRIRIVAVDPWLDDRWEFPTDYPLDAVRPGWGGEHADWAREQGGPFNAFVVQMRAHAPKVLEIAHVLRCRSVDAARIVGSCHGVLIDGSHNYEDVLCDIALWRTHILPGGILAGDDYSVRDFPGVVKACDDSFGAGQYEVRGTTWIKRR